jgi:hypothetical protein
MSASTAKIEGDAAGPKSERSDAISTHGLDEFPFPQPV